MTVMKDYTIENLKAENAKLREDLIEARTKAAEMKMTLARIRENFMKLCEMHQQVEALIEEHLIKPAEAQAARKARVNAVQARLAGRTS